jgi:hypothetical protein
LYLYNIKISIRMDKDLIDYILKKVLFSTLSQSKSPIIGRVSFTKNRYIDLKLEKYVRVDIMEEEYRTFSINKL